MSTIYTDAAGNKYLGDCRWGNHDINYPTTNWLKTETYYSANSVPLITDVADLYVQGGFASVSAVSDWVVLPGQARTFVSGIPSFSETPILFRGQFYGNGIFLSAFLSFSSLSTWFFTTNASVTPFSSSSYMSGWCKDDLGIALLNWNINSNRTSSVYTFYSCIKLVDVNTNFDYYSATPINSVVSLYRDNISSYYGGPYSRNLHYIVGATKNLLQSGRAIYDISCSDGQTPGSQWATDMWVYDNNATLGYPVIGRVPNMLLGIGTYTYLKPVKIEGSVFPDNGSPWYLPVGTFSGKVLLMRCYSSMT